MKRGKIYSGDLFDSSILANTQGVGTPAANQIRLNRFYLPDDAVLNSMMLEALTPAPNGMMKLLIYDSDSFEGFFPGTLLAQTGALSFDTPGMKFGEIGNLPLLCDQMIWLGVLSNSNAIAVRSLPANSAAQLSMGIADNGTHYKNVVVIDHPFNTPAPNTLNGICGPSNRVNKTIPRVILRAA